MSYNPASIPISSFTNTTSPKKKKINPKKLLSDPTAVILVISNILFLVFAIQLGVPLFQILIVYWIQSVIIGFFNFLKILTLKNFSTKGFMINGKSVEPTEGTKVFTALFFAFHYGFFHFIYLIFLITFLSMGTLSALHLVAPSTTQIQNASTIINGFIVMLVGAAIFFVNHLISFLFYLKKPKKKQNIGTIMFTPYARVVPMHLMIMFGFFLGAASIPAIAFFVFLKTIADLVMHTIEHTEQNI